MSRIFLSHSSTDNFASRALADWLNEEGWADVFLDIDPERGIAAGQRWERSLHQAADRCEAVIFLLTRSWLASGWCRKEYELARSLNKQLFAVIAERGLGIADLPPELKDTWQVTDLVAGTNHRVFRATLPSSEEEQHISFSRAGLARLRAGLKKAGLDAREFSWPLEGTKDPTPYVGLRALGPDEAGLFFGRDADLVKALDRLRGLSEAAAPRIAVILGASGAGKSSFLQAGLLPRVARDDTRFLCLPVIRPARDPIEGETGLIAALHAAMPSPHARADVRAAVDKGADGVRALLAPLVDAAVARSLGDRKTNRPLVVISIDQAEELFAAEVDSAALLTLLADLAQGNAPSVMLVFAIRSDAYDALERARELEGLAQLALPLLPMPRHAARAVIEGPATRYAASGRKLDLDPQLTQALLDDLDKGGGRDALPLLAFSLEHLWREYGRTGALTANHYVALGGVVGAIEAGVRRAYARADLDPRIPREAAARDMLLRRGLVPWLAGIDPDTRAPRRMVARAADIPVESKPLIDLLVEERLLSRSVDAANVATIEPAHEALLRQWSKLRGWLAEDFALLAALEAVQRASRDWDANGRSEFWLAHRGQRLTEAAALDQRPDVAAKLGVQDRAYLAACRAHEDATRIEAERVRADRDEATERKLRDAETLAEANRRRAKAVAIGLVAASILALLAAGGGGIAIHLEVVAKQQAELAAQKALDADAAAENATKAAEDAKRQSARADVQTRAALNNQAGALAALSMISVSKSPTLATKLALAAWPRSLVDPTPRLSVALLALSEPVINLKERRVLVGHQGTVAMAEFSPDGTRVVTASTDKTARVWDSATGRQLALLTGHEDEVVSAAFSPDGTRVVTGSADGTARVWDGLIARPIAVLRGHYGHVKTVAFSLDGSRVVTTSDDKTARVWDAVTGRSIAVLQAQEDVLSAAFSPDGTRIVTAAVWGSVRVWNATTGRQLVDLKGHLQQVNNASFSPNGTRIVTASLDKTARVWDATTGQQVAAFKGHLEQVNNALFSPDGTRVVTASADKTARVWDSATGRQLALLTGHEDEVVSAAFSPDGTRVVTGSADGTARVWDAAMGAIITVLRGHEGQVTSAAFSFDGARVVTASNDKTARIWDAGSIRGFTTLKSEEKVKIAMFSPRGSRVITTSDHNVLQIWNTITGRSVVIIKVFSGNIVSNVFSPDELRVVTLLDDKTARIWNAVTGRQIAVLTGHDDVVTHAEFSPDGARIVTISKDKTARVWNASTGHLEFTFGGQNEGVTSAVFSPDGLKVIMTCDGTVQIRDVSTGKSIEALTSDDGYDRKAIISLDPNIILTLSEDRNARIWDIRTASKISVLKGHVGDLLSAAFSPDGTIALTVSSDKTVKIWDIKTGTNLFVLKNTNDSSIFDASFSPDGSHVFVAFHDGTVRVWDTATGAALAMLATHDDNLDSASFSPDASLELTVSRDGMARLWNISSIPKGNIFHVACAWLPDHELTDVARDYGMTNLAPICEGDPPMPDLPAGAAR